VKHQVANTIKQSVLGGNKLEFHRSRFLVASSSDTFDTRGCHEDATRKLPPWNLRYTGCRDQY